MAAKPAYSALTASLRIKPFEICNTPQGVSSRTARVGLLVFQPRMATLNIASKANQATIFPALLVAHYAKEADPNSSIGVKFEEVDTLKAGDNATVEIVVGSGTSTYGSEKVINGLVEAYPFLQGKHDALVGSY